MTFNRSDWEIRTVPITVCWDMIRKYHYTGQGSNTATFRHGLFRRGRRTCMGVAWWLPPTKPAAIATYPDNWRGVLALHRLVIHPDVPTNGASFLIAASIKEIRKDGRWDCLVTYADESQGHTGIIYKATNWEYMGKTKPEPQWVDDDGKFVARLATHTRRVAEMKELGYRVLGSYSKHKFRMILREAK